MTDDTLRDRIYAAVASVLVMAPDTADAVTNRVLALPEVRDALAARQRATAALALADEWESWDDGFVSPLAADLRRALTGEA